MPERKTVRIAAQKQAQIRRALELDRTIKLLKEELDGIKADLRREAGLNLSNGVSEIVLEGDTAHASVIFPRCSYHIDQDRVLELKALLGDEFDRLVRVEHRVNPEYHDFQETLQGPLRGVLRSIVQPKATTPRVTLGEAGSD